MSYDAIHRHLSTRLIRHEAERFVVYDDATGQPIVKGSVVKGHPTIGVGRNLAGRGITKDESRLFLKNDIDACIAEVTEEWPWCDRMDDARFSVLVELAFNMGLPTLKTFKNTLKAMESGDYKSAAEGMMKSKWARDVGPYRSDRLARIMATGDW